MREIRDVDIERTLADRIGTLLSPISLSENDILQLASDIRCRLRQLGVADADLRGLGAISLWSELIDSAL
jgi:hypothetical protein